MNQEKQNAQLQRMNRELERLNRQQAQLIAQLHENEHRLTQFLEAMPVGVSVLDAAGKPFYVNQRAQELFGKGVLPSVGIEQWSEVYQVYRAGTNQLYPYEELPSMRALQGESSTADDLEINRGNRVIPVEVWAKPIYDQEGKVVYALQALQDISQRKKAEAERQELMAGLFEAICDLEVAVDAQSELAKAAKRFVPHEFISLLGRESIVSVQLGDQVEKEMSVLFADIRSFTTLSETMTPEDSFKFINAFLSRMEPAITQNNGFIDKYIGDAIMALFGNGADDALKAGVAMLKTLREYNKTRDRPKRKPIQIGIGVSTGYLMLGAVGGKNRIDSTAISDTVNLASRVEKLTKHYCVPFLISDHTYSQLQNPDCYAMRSIDKVQVKGKSKSVTIYEVFEADEVVLKEGKLATKEVFEQACSMYQQKYFEQAKLLFQECLRQNPDDIVARFYLQEM